MTHGSDNSDSLVINVNRAVEVGTTVPTLVLVMIVCSNVLLMPHQMKEQYGVDLDPAHYAKRLPRQLHDKNARMFHMNGYV